MSVMLSFANGAVAVFETLTTLQDTIENEFLTFATLEWHILTGQAFKVPTKTSHKG
jgi:hypothetical protein